MINPLSRKYAYGPDPNQYAELHLPAGKPVGVAVVIHGGFWRAQYDAGLCRPLALDLARHGLAAWNLEYRRPGNGGGWPETFDDVAAGIDELATAAREHGFGLDSVVAVGHSAGGHLAAWAAARDRLPAGTPGALPTSGTASNLAAAAGDRPAVPLTAVVSQSGVLNLRLARELRLGNDAVVNLLGSSAVHSPDRHWLADPMTHIPLGIPVFAVHARDDDTVPERLSRSYVSAALAAGAEAAFVEVPGGHMDLIDPASPAWARCRELVLAALRT